MRWSTVSRCLLVVPPEAYFRTASTFSLFHRTKLQVAPVWFKQLSIITVCVFVIIIDDWATIWYRSVQCMNDSHSEPLEIFFLLLKSAAQCSSVSHHCVF